MVLPISHDGVSSNSVTLVDLAGESESSDSVLSDRSGSGVEDEPLVVVTWVGSLDDHSELSTSNSSLSDKDSVGAHSGSDLESESVSEWGSWCVASALREEPGLVIMIVARPPGGLLHVSVASAPDVEAQVASNHPDGLLS